VLDPQVLMDHGSNGFDHELRGSGLTRSGYFNTLLINNATPVYYPSFDLFLSN
jgi:hypothetical protein